MRNWRHSRTSLCSLVSSVLTFAALSCGPAPLRGQLILVDTPVDAQGIAKEDIWIVSLGDSFSSGEGNPNVMPAVWADDLEAAGGIPYGKWLDDEKCHRSQWGWPYLVAEKAAERYARPVHFSFLACSGAELKEGLLEPFTGDGVHRAPQLDRLARLIEAVGHPPNAVLLSGGGNDIGFADIVEECIFPGNCPGGDATAALPGRADGLGGLYDQVATRLSDMGVASDRIFLLVYPDPLVGKKRLVFRRGWGSRRVLAACHLGAGPRMWGWASENVVELLQGMQEQAASAHGWGLIDGHHPTFLKHSYCPRNGLPGADSWWVGLLVTGVRQGSIHGTFHPNRRGHQNLAGWAFDEALSALETPVATDSRPEVVRLALDEVAGDWVRVGGNNPRNDGMQIRVEGSQATVMSMPPSGSERFGVGMVLWEDIEDDGTVQVQGSDRRYYDAELTMEGEDRLQLDVDHFGPGYEQTWERAGPAIDGDWVLVAADEEGNEGTRIRVEGDRATLRYVPAAASRDYRTGGVLWREIGAGDRRELGRLEALSGGRSYAPAQFRVSGDHLGLERDADGSVEHWARPGVAEELLARRAGGDVSAAPVLDPEIVVDPTSRAETLRRLDEAPTLDMHLLSAALKHPAAVVGLVFHDLDGDGTYDPGEPGLAGVTIKAVDSASDDVTTVTTDQDGLYRFESEGGMSHRISVEAASLPFGGELTTHPPEYEVEVLRGFTAPNINFGYRER